MALLKICSGVGGTTLNRQTFRVIFFYTIFFTLESFECYIGSAYFDIFLHSKIFVLVVCCLCSLQCQCLGISFEIWRCSVSHYSSGHKSDETEIVTISYAAVSATPGCPDSGSELNIAVRTLVTKSASVRIMGER